MLAGSDCCRPQRNRRDTDMGDRLDPCNGRTCIDDAVVRKPIVVTNHDGVCKEAPDLLMRHHVVPRRMV